MALHAVERYRPDAVANPDALALAEMIDRLDYRAEIEAEDPVKAAAYWTFVQRSWREYGGDEEDFSHLAESADMIRRASTRAEARGANSRGSWEQKFSKLANRVLGINE